MVSINTLPSNFRVMLSAKRRMDGGNKAASTVSFRFSEDLVDKINTRWKEDGFANRTALVEAACNLYFDSRECPRCGNRNHKNSLYCSICGIGLDPSYDLKKNLKIMYDDFLQYQEYIISLERGVEEERDEYDKKVGSSKLDQELKSSLENILKSAAEEYWLGTTVHILEISGLDEAIESVPMGYRDYADKMNSVKIFFESSTYIKDEPHLTLEKTTEIESLIDDLNDFQINYEIMLKRDLNLYQQVNKLIDTLNSTNYLKLESLVPKIPPY